MDGIARVRLAGLPLTADHEYDYDIPAQFCDSVCPGVRVVVPFGNGRLREAIVTECLSESSVSRRKPIASVLDTAPLLSQELQKLCAFMAERYFCTYYDAFRAVLPVGARHLQHANILPGQLPEDPDKDSLLAWTLLQNEGPCDRVEFLRRLTFSGIQRDAAETLLSQLIDCGVLKEAASVRARVQDATVRVVSLAVSPEEAEDFISSVKTRANAQKYAKILDVLRDDASLAVSEVAYLAGVGESCLKTLEKHGILTFSVQERFRSPLTRAINSGVQSAIQLNKTQQEAFDGLCPLLGHSGAALLYGVTGSGKTQVYMKLLDEVLKKDRTAIVLVPEISLTPQLTARFYERYGSRVAVLHSGLSLGERYDEWKRLKNGDAKIAVGTRSAIFAPLSNIGLIVLDEEQEHTYKSESTPRYHARDVAKFRALQNDALLLLASATPSVESYISAQEGRYHFFTLPVRYSNSGLPTVQIADLRSDLRRATSSSIGTELENALRETLSRGEQAILFLNRRGYNTFISCRKCGHVMLCPNCNISMTYHRKNHMLMCHYCGHMEEPQVNCPSCGHPQLSHFGYGTQKVEEDLEALFPDARILRMDLDTTSPRHSYEEMLSDFSTGKYDILLGTQMVTKGLDMPMVTLVGVISADSMLYLEDFRAGERAFSLLTQVVGRAGRAQRPGRAVIQTFTPDNPILHLAAEQNYPAFFDEEMLFRKTMIFPPFCDLYLFTIIADSEKRADTCAARIEALIRDKAAAAKDLPMMLFPQMPAPISKINNKYLHRVLVKCRDSAKLRSLMRSVLSDSAKDKLFNGCTVTVDVNPVQML